MSAFHSIHNILEGWARWREVGKHQNLGYGISFLQRCLEGMPGTNCPTCTGTGIVPGKTYNQPARFVECQTCNGSGKVQMNPGGNIVNPAFIRVTRRSQGHPTFERLDRLVCELGLQKKTKKLYDIIMAEYTRLWGEGDQRTMARRLDMKPTAYRKRLQRARDLLEIGLKG